MTRGKLDIREMNGVVGATKDEVVVVVAEEDDERGAALAISPRASAASCSAGSGTDCSCCLDRGVVSNSSNSSDELLYLCWLLL